MPHHRVAGGGPVPMIRVELLLVPGCPHVDAARRLLQSCLSEVGIQPRIEEREGAYPSPTILINGEDVMGRPPSMEASCRLDVPTRERLLAALVGVTT